MASTLNIKNQRRLLHWQFIRSWVNQRRRVLCRLWNEWSDGKNIRQRKTGRLHIKPPCQTNQHQTNLQIRHKALDNIRFILAEKTLTQHLNPITRPKRANKTIIIAKIKEIPPGLGHLKVQTRINLSPKPIKLLTNGLETNRKT